MRSKNEDRKTDAESMMAERSDHLFDNPSFESLCMADNWKWICQGFGLDKIN